MTLPGRVQRGFDGCVQLSLLADEPADILAPCFHGTVGSQLFFQRAQLAVIQRAGGLLAVARDKGHGIALVQQR